MSGRQRFLFVFNGCIEVIVLFVVVMADQKSTT